MNPKPQDDRTYYRFACAAPADRRIIVDHARKLVYCPIPKAACTTWKATLNRNPLPEESYEVHGPKTGFVYLADLAPELKADVLATYFKFTFVRHPLSRLLSVYLDKFERVHKKKGNVPNDFWHGFAVFIKGVVLDGGYYDINWPELTFPEFVRFVCRQDVERMNEHWAPQCTLLGDVQYDFVGRLERLQADSAYVCSKVGLPWPLPGQAQVGIAKTGAGALLDAYYTPELEQAVVGKYRPDFDRLGYAP